MAVNEGFIPVAPHIYFTQFLDDSVEKERKAGIEAGIQLMLECDEVWVFGEPTEGMRQEIECAERNGIPVKRFWSHLTISGNGDSSVEF